MKKILFGLLACLWLTGCSYVPSDGDVVNSHGEVTNAKRFSAFLQNVEKQKADRIRIVSYTTEGDAILTDLEYNQKIITYREDSKRDRFGDGGVTHASCTDVSEETTENGKHYKLEGCGKDKGTIDLMAVR